MRICKYTKYLFSFFFFFEENVEFTYNKLFKNKELLVIVRWFTKYSIFASTFDRYRLSLILYHFYFLSINEAGYIDSSSFSIFTFR